MDQCSSPWGAAETCFCKLAAVAADDRPEGDLSCWAESAGVAFPIDPREVVRAIAAWCAQADIGRTLAIWRQAVESRCSVAMLGIASALPYVCSFMPASGFGSPFGREQREASDLFSRTLRSVSDAGTLDHLGRALIATDMTMPSAQEFVTFLVRENRASFEKASSGTKGMLPLHR